MTYRQLAPAALLLIVSACTWKGSTDVPIGTIIPGTPTVVTPDASPAEITSVQVPSPTMGVQADNLAQLALELMNIKQRSLDRVDGHISGVVSVDNGAILESLPGSQVGLDGTIVFGVLVGTTVDFLGFTQFHALTKIAVGGTLEADGASVFNGAVALNAATTNTGVVANSGHGHREDRPVSIASNSDQNLGINDGDVIDLPSGIFFSSHDLVINDTGAGPGSRILIISRDSTHALTLKNGAGAIIGGHSLQAASGFYQWVEVMKYAGANNWQVVGFYLNP